MARVPWRADTQVPSAHIGGSTQICIVDTFPTCTCLAHAQNTYTHVSDLAKPPLGLLSGANWKAFIMDSQ